MTDENSVGANQRQVGGNHYAAGLQHWDLVERYGVGYLEGCATKYVTRHHKKGGLQDVQKAQHYLQKLMELHQEGVRVPRGIVPLNVLARFCGENKLPALEAGIVQTLCTWSTAAHLAAAMRDLRDLETEYTLFDQKA